MNILIALGVKIEDVGVGRDAWRREPKRSRSTSKAGYWAERYSPSLSCVEKRKHVRGQAGMTLTRKGFSATGFMGNR